MTILGYLLCGLAFAVFRSVLLTALVRFAPSTLQKPALSFWVFVTWLLLWPLELVGFVIWISVVLYVNVTTRLSTRRTLRRLGQ